MMHLTLYRGGRAPVPISQDDFETWDSVADSIEDLVSREYEDKLDMLAFAPHRLREPYRNLANVIEVTMMVIDVDVCDANKLARYLDTLGIDALMYGSPSDDLTKSNERRVRVVAPTDKPIDVASCGPCRLSFAEALGLYPGCGVEGALDASRLFFAGRLKGTPPREVWRFKANE
jgi:hypothetical protein